MGRGKWMVGRCRFRFLRSRSHHRIPSPQAVHRFAAYGAVALQIPSTAPIANLYRSVHRASATTMDTVAYHRHFGFGGSADLCGAHFNRPASAKAVPSASFRSRYNRLGVYPERRL